MYGKSTNQINTKNIFAIEYSIEQRCVHIQSLSQHLEITNRSLAIGKVLNDYQLVAISTSADEAFEIAESIQTMMSNRKKRCANGLV